MKKSKIFIILSLTILFVAILLPIGINTLIINNSFFSKGSADSWTGFFGSYIGSILGAISTVIAILIDIRYQESKRRMEHLVQIKPYLDVKTYRVETIEDNIHTVTLTLEAVSSYAVCNISIYDNDCDDKNKKPLNLDLCTIGSGQEKKVSIKINISKSLYYLARMYDIEGNMYEQEIRVSINEENYISNIFVLQPKCVKLANQSMYKNY